MSAPLDISYAKLHVAIHIPGLGEFGPTLTADLNNYKKVDKMSFDGSFLILEIKNHKVLVPEGNITHMVLRA